LEPKENGKALDNVIEEVTHVVENSREEIFEIAEDARMEYEHLNDELADIQKKVVLYIEEGDQLERRVRLSRQHLSEVSKHFDRYSEDEIREVYEKTHAMQTKLVMMQQEEKGLRQRRDELERRLIVLDETIDRAEGLTSKISIILPYLHDDFKYVNDMIEDAKEKQQFTVKIIEAQEEERKRISREIHDGPAQMMANILLRSELVERAFKDQSVETAITEIKSVRKMIRTSLQEVRRIIYDLRPMALDDLGLVPTIKRYVESTADYNNMRIEFLPVGKSIRLPQIYEVSIFRLIQESLQNAIKHAEANSIKVQLEITDHVITAVIKDDGIGFDSEIKRDKSFGLIGMKERIDMLKGDFKITSGQNKGTKIFIQVPYNRP